MTYEEDFTEDIAEMILEEKLSGKELAFESDSDRFNVTEAFESVTVGNVAYVEYVGNDEIVIHGTGNTTEYVEEIPATRHNPGDWVTRSVPVEWSVWYRMGDTDAEGSVEAHGSRR